MGLLGEILITLNKVYTRTHFYQVKLNIFSLSPLPQHIRDEDTGKVLGVLEVLSQSSRFNLSLDFLSKLEKRAVS